jgi:hypothetical protein
MSTIIKNISQKDLEWLARIQFLKVTTVLRHRRDLVSFLDKKNQKITANKPWFGGELANLGEEGLLNAKPVYSYYCGFAGEVHFCIGTRHRESVCCLPAEYSLLADQSPPRIGDLIMGEVEYAPDGGKRFTWWILVMEQDRRFAGVILRKISYTPEKLETKLTIDVGGRINKSLVILAKEFLQQ